MHSITRKHWLYGALADGPRLGYRGKAVALAALAAAAPLVVAAHHAAPVEMAALAAGTTAALAGLAYFLRPFGVLAHNLRAPSRGEPIEALGEGAPEDARRMAADLAWAKARIGALEESLPQAHAVTGLPGREALFAAIREDSGLTGHAVVLGVARMADYDRMAAFDQAAADRALRAFAQRLQDAVSPGRLLAHVERDCFALWFRGVDDPRVAAAEMQTIGAALGEQIGEGADALTPDVRLGAAIFPDDAADPATLLSRALTALPRDGRAAGGALAFFSPESSESARQRFSLEQELRQAVARGQMVLHFQPVVDLARGAVVGAEALVRWNRPGRGLAPPGLFIPVLEESGLMDEVGLWVLTEACRQARAWEEAGLVGLRMAVNLSARQFRDPALNALIVRTLEQQGLAPQRLELELTETAAMADVARTRQMFGDLRDMGVGVAIDDFGTGYSSLSYLKNLPFTKLKIDREFVDRLDERRDSRAICRALIELARGLDITVVAEGVETPEELAALRQLGCDTFQGFLFARPLPADDFARTITDPHWRRRLASPLHRDLADLRQRISA